MIVRTAAGRLAAAAMSCLALFTMSCGSTSTPYPTRVPTAVPARVEPAELANHLNERVSVAGTLFQTDNPTAFVRCDNTDAWHQGDYLCHWFGSDVGVANISLAMPHQSPDELTGQAEAYGIHLNPQGGLDWEEQEDHALKDIWVWDKNWNRLYPGDAVRAAGLLLKASGQEGQDLFSMIVESIQAGP